jgi:hypothetical protein
MLAGNLHSDNPNRSFNLAKKQILPNDFPSLHAAYVLPNTTTSDPKRERWKRTSMKSSLAFGLSVCCRLVILSLAVVRPTECAFAVQFSLAGGVYTNDLKLQLSAKAPATSIRFTLDGSEPTARSAVYSSAIAITNSALVRARAFVGKMPDGPTVSETYTLLDRDLWEFSSNLPLVVINTFGQGLSPDNKMPASIRFIDRGPDGRTSLTGTPDFVSASTIKIRGYSSLQFPKHSFSLQLKDEAGNKLKASILGFPADSLWVLYAPYTDKTLMRDVLAYGLSRDMGQYAPRAQYVELFLSRSGHKLSQRHYAGVYVLEEKIKRSKDRVNLEKLTPADSKKPEITGGYIFKKDHEDRGSAGGFRTSHGIHFFFVDPKEEELTELQKAWLTGYLNRFERALYGPDFKDPVHGYAEYIDPDSFLDVHWVVELSKNIDGYRLSSYLHKDRNGKLKAGPIWDWNLSFGNADYLEGWMPDGWYWPLISQRDHLWFGRLFEDADFKQKYIDRWSQLRTDQFATSNILAKVDAMSLQLQEAQERNFKRWRILGQHVWPNSYVGKTYTEEVNWMKRWIKQRIAWIDSQFLAPPSAVITNGAKVSDRFLSLQVPAGEIYYTLDGTDPRSSGGSVSPKAQLYRNAISLGEKAEIMARVYAKKSWSAPVIYPPRK